MDDGIADELARSVVGDVAAAFDAAYIDPLAVERVLRGQDMALMGTSSQGNHRGMLQQEQRVLDQPSLAPINEFEL